MTRLGVGPNLVMSKAVYVQDLENAALENYLAFDEPGNKWYVIVRGKSRTQVALLTALCKF